MKQYKVMKLLALLLGTFTATAGATETLGFDPGTSYTVQPSMEDFATLGSQMAGMQMTVVQGGISQLYTWQVLQDDFGGFTRGGVIADGFVIHATGDTWCFSLCASWFVQTRPFQPAISQVVFHGAPGGIVFDLSTQPASNFGTPGSAKGWTFSLKQVSNPMDIAAMYRNEVSVGGAAVVGDLYTTLEVNFLGLGLRGGQFIQFGADTDQIPPGATISLAMPEPHGSALGALGLVAVLALRRRRAGRAGHRPPRNRQAAPAFSPRHC